MDVGVDEAGNDDAIGVVGPLALGVDLRPRPRLGHPAVFDPEPGVLQHSAVPVDERPAVYVHAPVCGGRPQISYRPGGRRLGEAGVDDAVEDAGAVALHDGRLESLDFAVGLVGRRP